MITDREIAAALDPEVDPQFEAARERALESALSIIRVSPGTTAPTRRVRKVLLLAAATVLVMTVSAVAASDVGDWPILDRLGVFDEPEREKPIDFTVDGVARGLPAELGLEKSDAARRLIDDRGQGRSVVMDATVTTTGNACFSVAVTNHGLEDRIAGCSMELPSDWPIQESLSVAQSWYSIQGFMGDDVSLVRVTSTKGTTSAITGPNGYVWVSDGLDDRPMTIEITRQDGHTLKRPFTKLEFLEQDGKRARAMSNCVLTRTIAECDPKLKRP